MIPIALLPCALLAGAALASGEPAATAARRERPPVSLRETLLPSAIVDAGRGSLRIAGRAEGAAAQVLLRVTTSLGIQSEARAPVRDGFFACPYPEDFPGAPALGPCVLFIDATAEKDFRPELPGRFQAEATLIVHDAARRLPPDLPSAFTNDLLDAGGRTDRQCREWPVIRALVRLYMGSRAARTVGIGRLDFDIERPADLRFFKDNLTLYEFDHRDRDWSAPMGRRLRRTFWQAVWNTWFNAGNDHPIDGNDFNRAPSNFRPYAFTNDFADILLIYLLKRPGMPALDDNLPAICAEGVENLLALQQRGPENFALPDARGGRETYTAGAFRYGLFENGEDLTEGKGWFHRLEHLDYIRGGVFNGRAVWALGEALKRDPSGPLAPRLKDAMALALKFCLVDALPLGYARKTPRGNVCWYDAGEHGYLLTGMLAAASVDPAMSVPALNGRSVPLREACASALNALVDLEEPHRQWSVYPNKDALALIALADGAALLRDHCDAPRWRAAAMGVADAWLAAEVDPREHPEPVVHIGLRTAPDRMTFNWRRLSKDCADRNTIHFYITGHWIHALARLAALTGEARYRERAEAMVRYLCGDNPWQVRLFNELGGVYNWVDDWDGDGVEDILKQDMYPESTAFCQIGILHLIEALAANKS